MLGIYLIVGAFAGTASGLLGIGGGIIVVPALEAIFATSIFIPPSYVMHMAIGTSLAIMVFTTLSGSYAYLKRGSIRWPMIKQLLPYLLIGAIVGVLIANFLPSRFLRIIFAVFLMLISLHMLIGHHSHRDAKRIPQSIVSWIAVFIGALTSILGAGGGAMQVPFLLRLQLEIREALGTSLVCSIFTSLVAASCFMLTGLITPEKIAWSTGYIYWPAWVGITIASVLFAPFGVALAHKLPTPLLKRIFAAFLLLIALDMFIFSR